MIFEDGTEVAAPAPAVWAFLIDVNRFSGCVPGLDEVKELDEDTFEGSMTAKVGPMSGKFRFEARIVERQEPHHLRAEVHGSDSVTKSKVEVRLGLELTALPNDRTQLHYRSEVDINGRLAILGDMVLRATAAVMMSEFTDRLRRTIEAEVGGTAQSPATPAG